MFVFTIIHLLYNQQNFLNYSNITERFVNLPPNNSTSIISSSKLDDVLHHDTITTLENIHDKNDLWKILYHENIRYILLLGLMIWFIKWNFLFDRKKLHAEKARAESVEKVEEKNTQTVFQNMSYTTNTDAIQQDQFPQYLQYDIEDLISELG